MHLSEILSTTLEDKQNFKARLSQMLNIDACHLGETELPYRHLNEKIHEVFHGDGPHQLPLKTMSFCNMQSFTGNVICLLGCIQNKLGVAAGL